MPRPISSQSPAPPVIDLEPVLITGHASKPAAPAPVPVKEVARECVAEGVGIAAALLSKGSTNLLAVAAAAGGAGIAFGACVTKTTHQLETDASIRRAIERCVDAGGAPGGAVDGTLHCFVVQ